MPQQINVTRSSMPPFEEYVEEIRPLWESRWLTNMGEKHCQLEQQLAEKLGAGRVSLFTNGHMALELLLQAMGLEGEVLTTPFTFVSTTHAICRAGLTPVFCDVKESDGTLDPAKLEEHITPRTCAILPVHVYGNLCDTEAIDAIAKKHGLKVIYDAAHAFGVEKNGRKAGSFGDASMFSFHATKVFHTIEGGGVCCDDPEVHETLDHLRDFGSQDAEHVGYVAPNAKMNEFCAAMGLCNLRHLDQAIAARRAAVEQYRKRLGGVPGLRLLLAEGEGLTSNYAYMPVTFDEAVFGESRDEVMSRLAAEGIGARKYFYPLVSDYACYRETYHSSETPVARHLASQVLTLPLFEELGADGADEICDVILKGPGSNPRK